MSDNSYENFSKKDLINWIEYCHELLDGCGVVRDTKGGAQYSVYGRLSVYKSTTEETIAALTTRLQEAEAVMLELAGEEECDDGFNVFDHPEHTCIDAERTRRAAAWLKGGTE